MDVRERIQQLEGVASGFREGRKAIDKEGSEEQRKSLYLQICERMKVFVKAARRRIFFQNLFNKPVAMKLQVFADLIYRAYDLLLDEEMILTSNGKGADEDILEYSITIKQLEKKIKQLDQQILEMAGKISQTPSRKLFSSFGAMLTLRHTAALFVLLDTDTGTTTALLDRLEKDFPSVSSSRTNSPLHYRHRCRPTNENYPF